MLEQGLQFAKYSVIPRTLVFVFRGNDVLLIKGAQDKKIWAGLYNGIGGHVEPGEDVLFSARRELQEETGLMQIPLHLCGQVMIDTGTAQGVALFVFKGTTDQTGIIPSDECQPEWIPIQSLSSIEMVRDLYQLLPRVIHWQMGDDLIVARYHYSSEGKIEAEFSDRSGL
jgi:8-oxo-dGTP diphosphatase